MEDFRRTSACGVFNDPKLFPIPGHEAMRIVYDIRRIDTYGDSSVIACLTYSEAAQLVENYAAAQRQAGREEERRELAEGYAASILELDKRYAALVEAAVALTKEWYGRCNHDDISNGISCLRKALRALDEAKGGNNA